MSFIVMDGDSEVVVNTPCDRCDPTYEGGAMKSAKELFKIGWHVHKDESVGHGGYAIFIDESLMDRYMERYPGGPIGQLLEAVDKDK